jgi:hypothetical protein
MTEVLSADLNNQLAEGEENHESGKPLTIETICEGLSSIARTGDGLAHAFIRLHIPGKGVTSANLLSQYPHLRFVVNPLH